MYYSWNMPKLIQRYDYPQTVTYIELFDDGVAVLSYGRPTVDLEENTAETTWVIAQFDAIKTQKLVDGLYVLLDMTHIDSAEYTSDESTDLYKKMLLDSFTKRVAMYGAHAGWDLTVELYRFFGKNKMRAFITEQSARDWLLKKMHRAQEKIAKS